MNAIANQSSTGQSPGQPPKYLFETPPPPIPPEDINETISSDVVVVGAGISRLIAALSASQAGVSINSIEKTPTFSARGGDIKALNSRLHEKPGIHIDENKVLHDMMKVPVYTFKKTTNRYKELVKIGRDLDFSINVTTG